MEIATANRRGVIIPWRKQEPEAWKSGCSIGNSKSQLHKARMKLRDLLKTRGAEKAVQR